MKLVENWRQSWRWWSMRLNAAAALLITYVLAAPDVLLSVLNSLPADTRAVFPPAAGIVIFLLVAGVRLYKQNHKDDEK